MMRLIVLGARLIGKHQLSVVQVAGLELRRGWSWVAFAPGKPNRYRLNRLPRF